MRPSLLVAASLLAALPAAASPMLFDCPRVIDTAPVTQPTDHEWEPVADTGLPPSKLATVAVYAQHPSDGGNLVPDHSERLENTELTLWRLPPDSAPYWVACVYRYSRTLLAREIPLAARQCRLTTALDGQQAGEVLTFVCE